MSYLPTSKWGVCSVCGGKEQEVVKVKKDLFCLQCRNSQKTEELISKQKKRLAARNTGNKLRTTLAKEDFSREDEERNNITKEDLMMSCESILGSKYSMEEVDKEIKTIIAKL